MSFYKKIKGAFDTLPGDLSHATMATALHVGAKSIGGFFKNQKGVVHLAPYWTELWMEFARLRQFPLSAEEADQLSGLLIASLEKLDNGIDLAETIFAKVRILFPALVTLRLCRDSLITIVIGRAAAHAFLANKGDQTVAEMARTILGAVDSSN